ncbi:cytochrome c oxidase subunit II [Candidatus Caldarchaeum subterraneum]|uniref:Cytochrome c oxidase subunit II n=1 Tax=Caldiarchaeum subterraneum TaxID=311458 RepID=E6N8L4_CALS0|nr:cytochrome c oxidase subunit II [Candidatus Caldarchaeum subterraneum]BAJ51338.1 cytochrome c oxidase subunit II [Candidatus Caldarchaeum subterraneum]
MERVKLVENATIVGALILFVVIGFWSWNVLNDLEANKPADLTVKVVARQFAWQFVYPDGTVSGELRVKAGQTVRLELNSEDVIHSFYLRDFGLKKDVVPGRTNVLYVTPLEPGTYLIQCAEFCGQGHYSMRANMVVEP